MTNKKALFLRKKVTLLKRLISTKCAKSESKIIEQLSLKVETLSDKADLIELYLQL